MSYEFIEVEKRRHLTIVTINRPNVLNALHPLACGELDQAFNGVELDIFRDSQLIQTIFVRGKHDGI